MENQDGTMRRRSLLKLAGTGAGIGLGGGALSGQASAQPADGVTVVFADRSRVTAKRVALEE